MVNNQLCTYMKNAFEVTFKQEATFTFSNQTPVLGSCRFSLCALIIHHDLCVRACINTCLLHQVLEISPPQVIFTTHDLPSNRFVQLRCAFLPEVRMFSSRLKYLAGARILESILAQMVNLSLLFVLAFSIGNSGLDFSPIFSTCSENQLFKFYLMLGSEVIGIYDLIRGS